MTFGTLSTLDALAATQASVVEYGEDRAWNDIRVAFEARNRERNEMFGALVERTTDRQRRYGTAASKSMQRLDQFGRARAQKVTAGATVGFPLELFGDALQWTFKFLQQAGSAARIAAEVQAITDADAKLDLYAIKSALMTPTNYTFNDVLIDDVALAVKRLVNADSAEIPLGPNGETFVGATHNHYLFTAGTTLALADFTALTDTVLEHHNTGTVVVYINRAQETAVRALSGFLAFLDIRVERGGGATTDVARGSLDVMNPNNRDIGVLGAAEIRVRSWVPSGYLIATVLGAPPPLVYRERTAGSGDLTLVFEDERHPLRARGYEREFGMGVWTRTNAAILFIDAGAAGAYVAPTLSL